MFMILSIYSTCKVWTLLDMNMSRKRNFLMILSIYSTYKVWTLSDMNMSRKCNFQLHLSEASVTLKINQNHHDWYGDGKLNWGNHYASFEWFIKIFFKKEQTLKFLHSWKTQQFSSLDANHSHARHLLCDHIHDHDRVQEAHTAWAW